MAQRIGSDPRQLSDGHRLLLHALLLCARLDTAQVPNAAAVRPFLQPATAYQLVRDTSTSPDTVAPYAPQAFSGLLSRWLADVEHWTSLALPEEVSLLEAWVQMWLSGQMPPARCAAHVRGLPRQCMRTSWAANFASSESPYCCEEHACLTTDCLHCRISPHVTFCAAHCCNAIVHGHIGLQPFACPMERISSAEHCSEHCCPTCLLSREEVVSCRVGLHACLQHQCALDNCDQAQLCPYAFCVDHCCTRCVEQGQLSDSPRCWPSLLCDAHKCGVPSCAEERTVDSGGYQHFCTQHTCRMPACGECVDLSFPQTARAGLCLLHRCAHPYYPPCLRHRMVLDNELDSLFCPEHTCHVCLQQGLPLESPVSAPPPRNVCDAHSLCEYVLAGGLTCNALQSSSSYCAVHDAAVKEHSKVKDVFLAAAGWQHMDGQCCGISKKEKRCGTKSAEPVRNAYWFCGTHESQRDLVDHAVQRARYLSMPAQPARFLPQSLQLTLCTEADADAVGKMDAGGDDGESDSSDSGSSDGSSEGSSDGSSDDGSDGNSEDGSGEGGSGSSSSYSLCSWEDTAAATEHKMCTDSSASTGTERQHAGATSVSGQKCVAVAERLSAGYVVLQCGERSLLTQLQCSVRQLVYGGDAEASVDKYGVWLCPGHVAARDRSSRALKVANTPAAPPVQRPPVPPRQKGAGTGIGAGSRKRAASSANLPPPPPPAPALPEQYEIVHDADFLDVEGVGAGVDPDEMDFEALDCNPPSGPAAEELQGKDACLKEGGVEMEVGEGEGEGEEGEEAEEPVENDEQRRLREILGGSDSDDDYEADDDGGVFAKLGMVEDALTPEQALQASALCVQSWTWDMPGTARLHAASVFLRTMVAVQGALLCATEEHLADARREKAEASAASLKRACVVGATVVGASRRLHAIRAAEPFAVVVEEACEILEPTLMSVLAVKSLRKLELIGDHRQLPAFLQNHWYNLEMALPSIKTSLFERLITGKVSARDKQAHQVNCTVLDEQRRMRECISDLTRDHYSDLVTVIDHPHTAQQRVADVALRRGPKTALQSTVDMWDGDGRPVPGMQSCIYFWNLPGNAESRPMAGLSACNQAEAAAVVALVKHLQLCGVPGAAVSVITPYKGQKMLITKLLRKEKCLPAYVPNQKAPSPDCVYVSTVDRYQGDENDIVILSLVRTRPGNRFVALLNRFIVAVSRARLGFYIVGAVDGVTKTASGADGPVHWRDLVTQLSATPMPNPAEAGGFSRGRVGPGIPLCCPQHRSSVCDASSATEFPTAANWEKLCQETCSFALPCGHPCGKQCHCHKTTMAAHTDQCLVVLDRPCVRHQDVPLLCKDIPRPQGCSLARALGCFLCMEMVCFQRPECSHRLDVHCHTLDGSGPQLSDCAVRVGDFHHPACGHVFQQLTCCKRRLYEQTPPVCGRKVERVRPCGCTLKMSCHEAIAEAKAEASVRCLTDVSTCRPRCKHRLSLRCHDARELQSAWNLCGGYGIEAGGSVQWGEQYGPTEGSLLSLAIPDCHIPVTFVGPCGHSFRGVPCAQAFQMARSEAVEGLKCISAVQIPCALCGGDVTAPCWLADEVRRWDPWGVPTLGVVRTEGVLQVQETAILSAQALVPDARVLQALLQLCTQQIVMVRACSLPSAQPQIRHTETMQCRALAATLLRKRRLRPCVKQIARLLRCGHIVEVRCCEKEELPAPHCRARNADVYPFSCGSHSFTPGSCYELQQLLSAADPPPCCSPVQSMLFRCKHTVEVPCHQVAEVVAQHGAGKALEVRDMEGSATRTVLADEFYCSPCGVTAQCGELVSFRYVCGHSRGNVPCYRAFEWTASGELQPPACDAEVSAAHPVCGHDVQVACWAAQAVGTWDPWAGAGPPAVECITGSIGSGGGAGQGQGQEQGLEQEQGASAVLLLREEDLRERVAFPTRALQGALVLACKEPITLVRLCGHSVEYPCCRIFAEKPPPCLEIVELKCPDPLCGHTREVTCHQRQTTEQKCVNMVTRSCSVCSINGVTAQCWRKSYACRSRVSVELAQCGHRISWQCGEEADPRTLQACERVCKVCAQEHWAAAISALPAQHELEVFGEAAFDRAVREVERLSSVDSAHRMPIVTPGHSSLLQNHVTARQQILRKAYDFAYLKDGGSAWQSALPEFASSEDFDLHYPLVYSVLRSAKRDAGQELAARESSAMKNFTQQEDTHFGRGVALHPLCMESLQQQAAEDGTILICVGAVYSRKRLDAPGPFVPQKVKSKRRDAANKKANHLRKEAVDSGFDCVSTAEEDPSSGKTFHWVPGAAVPCAILQLRLRTPCSICGDAFAKTQGLRCSAGHLVCWETCFHSYVQAAAEPGAIKYYDDGGNLCCPECRESYSLQAVAAQGGPATVFDALLQLKMDLCTRKTVEGELSEQETRLREEFRQIQAVTDADEREAIIQRMDIADNVLTLRCPRVGCHRAFVDFEGCFALSCSGCRAGFCGWCLADCGADAHAHIAGCGGTYGTLDQFNEVHRVRRAKVVRERLQQMRPEVRRHVQRMLKVDLRDLGIPPEP